MNYELSADVARRVDALREIASTRLASDAADQDVGDARRREEILSTHLRLAAQHRVVGGACDDGGARDLVAFAALMEEVGAGSPSTALALSTAEAAAAILSRHGDDEQKQRALDPYLAGHALVSLAYAEHESGSDAPGVLLSATQDGDAFVLSGKKRWVTGAPVAPAMLVVAREGEGDALSLFLVSRTAPGVHVHPAIETMGVRGAPVADVDFADVRVLPADRVGKPGQGRALLDEGFAAGRLSIAAAWIGLSREALAISVKHARTRKSGGKPIVRNQEISFKLARMQMLIDVARLSCQYAAWTMGEGDPEAAINVSCAKVQATEAATNISSLAVQIAGGAGYEAGHPVERLYRDARVGELLFGPTEIHRVAIARDVLAKAGG